MRYDREILVDVLVHHQRITSQYCHCGWGELGRSHPEHIATEYEHAVAEATKLNYSHDGIRLNRVIRPRDQH